MTIKMKTRRGPMGCPCNSPVIDSGTLSRTASPQRGVTGAQMLWLAPGGPGSSQAQSAPAKAKVLILVGGGQGYLKKGVRYNSNKYFDQAARKSLDQYTKGYDVVIEHVNSAKKMKELIESREWNKVIYFGHGVLNQMALAPDPSGNGKILKIDEFAKVLSKAKVKEVYLFGCRSGYTGLARNLSRKLKRTVYGTFNDLDVEWVQKGGSSGKIDTNEFNFKESLTEYTNGFQTKDGKKTEQRREERNDPVNISNDPLSENPMIDQ